MTLLFFGLAIVCRAISELQQHHKLRWQDEEKDYFSFWGRNSWVRKYKRSNGKSTAIFQVIKKPNWYYRLFKLKYKERFPLSATFLVSITDGYHMCQSLFFIFLSLGITTSTGYSFIWVWPGVVFVHFITYRIFQR